MDSVDARAASNQSSLAPPLQRWLLSNGGDDLNETFSEPREGVQLINSTVGGNLEYHSHHYSASESKLVRIERLNSELERWLEICLGSEASSDIKSPLISNAATRLFLTEPSHLAFKTWYHPDVCQYLLQLSDNKPLCIRVVFLDADSGDNTRTFKEQLQSLIVLGNRMQKSAIFIAKEPGAQNHFICGLVKKNRLLLINPLGISTHLDAYQTLMELQKEGILSDIGLSSQKLQNREYEGEGLYSCGPITLELAMHLLTHVTEFELNQFWVDIFNKKPNTHSKTGLKYFVVAIDKLLSTSRLLGLEHTDNAVLYKEKILALRQKHLEQLQRLPELCAKTEGLSVERYLTQCKNEAPSQVLFNALLTRHKAAYNIHELPEYKKLEQVFKNSISLLPSIPVFEKESLKIADNLIQLGTQYKEYGHLTHAIFCYIIALKIKTILNIKAEDLVSILTTCCLEFSKTIEEPLLFRFVFLNNVHVIEFLLNNPSLSGDINPLFQRRTLLNVVCEEGHLNILELLLEKKVDITKNSHRETCLYSAAKAGQENIVERLLLRLEASQMIDLPNKSDNCDDTALHIAVKMGHFGIARKLIQANANLMKKNKVDHLGSMLLPGRTVFVELVRSGQGKVDEQDSLACFLLEKEPCFKEALNESLSEEIVKNGLYCLFKKNCADFVNNANILKLIEIAAYNIDTKPEEKNFSEARLNASRQLLKYLLSIAKQKKLETTFMLRKINNFLGNILCFCAQEGDLETIKHILSLYPEAKEQAFGQKIPLDYAVMNHKDDVTVVEALFNPEVINYVREHRTLLHRTLLLTKPNIKIAEFLLRNGASPNVKDTYQEKETCLILIAKRCVNTMSGQMVQSYLEMATLFIQYGADVNLSDSTGNTPLSIQENMRGGGHEGLIKLFRQSLEFRAQQSVYPQINPQDASFVQNNTANVSNNSVGRDLIVNNHNTQVISFPGHPEDIERIRIKCQDTLKAVYQLQKTIPSLFGKPFVLDGQYINLEIIYTADEEDTKEKDNKETQKPKSQDGRIATFEALFATKKSIGLERLFEPDAKLQDIFGHQKIKSPLSPNESPSTVLVLGRAGSGKTTAVSHIALEWAENILYTKYDWVFVLTLRQLKEFSKQPKVIENPALWRWVYESQFNATGLEANHFKQLWEKEIEPNLNSNVLFILDGYDELPQEHAFTIALAQLLNSNTPKLITSRPYGLGGISDKRRELELIGFTEDNVHRYIQIYFTEEPEKAKGFIENAKTNQLLWSNCHIPINLNILCGILSESKDYISVLNQLATEQGMFGLYRQMEQKLFERHLKQAEPALYQNRIENQTRTTQDKAQFLFKEEYTLERRLLSELFFKAMTQDTLVISQEAIQTLAEPLQKEADARKEKRGEAKTQGKRHSEPTSDLISLITQLGILKPTPDGQYEPLHYTFQEYYAAIYIAESFKQQGWSLGLLKGAPNPLEPGVLYLSAGKQVLKYKVAHLEGIKTLSWDFLDEDKIKTALENAEKTKDLTQLNKSCLYEILIETAKQNHTTLEQRSAIELKRKDILALKLNPRFQIIFWFVAGLLRDDQRALNNYLAILEGRLSPESKPLSQDLFQHYELALLTCCLAEANLVTLQDTEKTQYRPIIVRTLFRIQQTLKILFLCYDKHEFRSFQSPLLRALSQIAPVWHRNLTRNLLNFESTPKALLSFSAHIGIINQTISGALAQALKNEDELVRNAAEKQLCSLISHLSAPVREELANEVLSRALENEDWGVRRDALRVFSILIPYLSSSTQEVLNEPIKETLFRALGDKGWAVVRRDTFKALSTLIPYLSAAVQEALNEPIKKALSLALGGNWLIREGTLEAFPLLVPHLSVWVAEELAKEALYRVFNVKGYNVNQDALKALSILAPYLLVSVCKEFSEEALSRALMDEDRGVRQDALRVFSMLIPYLSVSVQEELKEPIKRTLSRVFVDEDWIVRQNALEAFHLLIPHLSVSVREALEKSTKKALSRALVGEDWAVCLDALKTLPSLVPYLSASIRKALEESTKKALSKALVSKNQTVSRDAFRVLSVLIPCLSGSVCEAFEGPIKEVLSPAFVDEDWAVCLDALQILPSLVPYLSASIRKALEESTKKALSRALVSKNQTVSRDAFRVLPVLIQCLSGSVREALEGPIEEALSRAILDKDSIISSPNVLKTLLALVPYISVSVREAFEGLTREALSRAFEGKDKTVRRDALRVLSILTPFLLAPVGEELVKEVLSQILDDKERVIRRNALQVLSTLIQHFSTPVREKELERLIKERLSRVLMDENRDVNRNAFSVLSTLIPYLSISVGEVLAKEALFQLLKDPNKDIGMSVISTLISRLTVSAREEFLKKVLFEILEGEDRTVNQAIFNTFVVMFSDREVKLLLEKKLTTKLALETLEYFERCRSSFETQVQKEPVLKTPSLELLMLGYLSGNIAARMDEDKVEVYVGKDRIEYLLTPEIAKTLRSMAVNYIQRLIQLLEPAGLEIEQKIVVAEAKNETIFEATEQNKPASITSKALWPVKAEVAAITAWAESSVNPISGELRVLEDFKLTRGIPITPQYTAERGARLEAVNSRFDELESKNISEVKKS